MVLASDNRCNEKHGVTDGERSLFGDLLAAAALAAAATSAYKAYDIAVKEWEMAKKYWRISQNWMDYYKNAYAPVEDQEIAEALQLEEAEPLYEVARGRARASAWIEFQGKLRNPMRCMSRYCTGLRGDILVQVSRAQADAVALADGLGYRNERAYVETRNDVRFEKRLNTAKRGRDIISDTVSLGAAAAGIYGDLLDQAWQGLTGAGQYLGYYLNRNQPAYPTTYMAGRATPVQAPLAQGRFNDTSEAGEALMRQWL